MISYAGIDLTDVTAKTQGWLSSLIDHSWSSIAAGSFWPEPPSVWPGPAQLGTLYWPAHGAGVHARGFFLVDSPSLDKIRSLCYRDTGVRPGTLLVDDGVNSVSFQMYLLHPPVPLAEVYGGSNIPGVKDQANSLWLLPLVDRRFLWRDTTFGLGYIADTWEGLYTQVAAALDPLVGGLEVSITVDDVASEYGSPPDYLLGHQGAYTTFLDTIADSIGHRLCFLPDGTIRSRAAINSYTRHKLNLALAERLAGGHLRVIHRPDADDGLPNYPDSVRVVFNAIGGDHGVTINLDDLNLSAFLGETADRDLTLVHETRTHTFRSTAGGGASNPRLNGLAQRVATDHYLHLSGRAEARYEGVVPWVMEGLTGWVEYEHALGRVSTRVRRVRRREVVPALAHTDTEYGYGPITVHYGSTYYQGWGLLLEDGTPIILEDGTVLVAGDGPTVTFGSGSSVVFDGGTVVLNSSLVITGEELILEDGSALLLEDGTQLVISTADITLGEFSHLEVCGVLSRCATTVTITTDTHNQPVESSLLVVVPSGGNSLDLTGLVPLVTDGGSVPQMVTIINGGTDPLTPVVLTHQDSGSTITNRFDLPGGVDIPLGVDDSITLWYDTTDEVWRPLNGTTATVRPYEPSLTGTHNNYWIPSNTSALIPTLTGATTLTGLNNVPLGTVLMVVNPLTNSDDLTLSHLDGGSSAANQFDFSSGVDLVLEPGNSVLLTYDGGKFTEAGTSIALAGGGGGARTEGTLAAAGSSQGDAAAIVDHSTIVSGASGTNGVRLPSDMEAEILVVRNDDAINGLLVYPQSGAAIGTLGTNNADTISITSSHIYYRLSSTVWAKQTIL